jgi:hypothetical protein
MSPLPGKLDGTRIQAKEAARKLDLKYRLGLADRGKAKFNGKASNSGDETAATTGSRPVCWEVFKSSKLQYPLAIALVRVGLLVDVQFVSLESAHPCLQQLLLLFQPLFHCCCSKYLQYHCHPVEPRVFLCFAQ